jgi:hypothetical protein
MVVFLDSVWYMVQDELILDQNSWLFSLSLYLLFLGLLLRFQHVVLSVKWGRLLTFSFKDLRDFILDPVSEVGENNFL